MGGRHRPCVRMAKAMVSVPIFIAVMTMPSASSGSESPWRPVHVNLTESCAASAMAPCTTALASGPPVEQLLADVHRALDRR